MAGLLEEGSPSGPVQAGRGVQGQYVYWITMSQPKPETIEQLGVKVPADFTRDEFSELIVKAHADVEIDIVETIVFLELHSSGEKHHNCLVRAKKMFRWKKPADNLRQTYKVCVDYGSNIRTWAQGVIYGRIASEHKQPEMLDHGYVQWAKNGAPMQLNEIIPKYMQKEGFVRKTKLTPMAFLDLCRNNNLYTEKDVWAFATSLEEKGDKGLMAYLMEGDVAVMMARVLKAVGSKEAQRREKLSRIQILEEALQRNSCSCKQPEECYNLMKDVLHMNNLDGVFQKSVIGTLVAGRQKMRNLCLVGGPGTAKSFLFKPLMMIYNTYTRPDGGSYQLEELLGKEMVFLNDFEYDDDAKKWCPWGYFKRFLEGEPLTVARPKNRGGNAPFDSDAPVFITAPQEIALYRGKKRDDYETSQMEDRVAYASMQYTIPKHMRKEVAPCIHCGARLYTEGLHQNQSGGVKRMHELVEAPTADPPRTKTKTGVDMLQALKEVQELKQTGFLCSPEAKLLKDRILNESRSMSNS